MPCFCESGVIGDNDDAGSDMEVHRVPDNAVPEQHNNPLSQVVANMSHDR